MNQCELTLPVVPVRQRTIGSPARDYVPLLRTAGWLRYVAGKVLGIKNWSYDEQEEKAREYRIKQQVYIQKMLGELKDRIEDGDQTPSIMGNIFRQGLLKDEEILLASYTGSMTPPTGPSSLFKSSLLTSEFSRCGDQSWLLPYMDCRVPGQPTRSSTEWLRGNQGGLPRPAPNALRI